MTTIPIGWPTAQRISDIPAVHEALEAFSHDSTEDNAVALICAVLNASPYAAGRAAGLEEIIDMLDKFGTLKYRAGCTTHKTSLELLEQAHAYRHMIHEALTALSPTSSDAGKDDALAEAIRDAIAENMTGLYYCCRTWSAWHVGTMTQNDFWPAGDDDEIIQNITDGVMAAIAAQGEGK